jgi:DNA (cytosine-5)-methyltransferase 1
MKTLKILNAYAGIGGNRKLWTDVEVTAVELNPEIAAIYKDFFPEDEVIVADAHQYLLDHYKEYDFIWSSPPCPTHSRVRYVTTKFKTDCPGYDRDVVYADMKLYQEVILLEKYHTGLWVVENVIPYYTPLIPAREISRHLFWSNFIINKNIKFETADIRFGKVSEYEDQHGFDISKYKIKHRKDQILRNCVNPDLGLYILEQARGIIREENAQQTKLEI